MPRRQQQKSVTVQKLPKPNLRGRPTSRRTANIQVLELDDSADSNVIISGDLDPSASIPVAGPSGFGTSFKVPNRHAPSASSSPPSNLLPPQSKQRKKGSTSERAEQLLREDLPSDILNTRRPATKVRFIPKKAASGDKSKEDIDLDQPGVKESVEICQGFSKIKLEDWHAFFDFKHNAKSEPGEYINVTPEANNTSTVDEGSGEDEDDEWEETLVYVDLEDIPHADGLFASLAPPNGDNEEAEEESGSSLSHIEMKIFNMDSELPVLLLGGKYLAGQWQDTIGTSLFFKKKSEQLPSSPTPHSSSDPPASSSKRNLNNIEPQPEIPFDQLFGDNYMCKEEEGYELVAKSFKVLKAKQVPVVNEDQKREDFIRDNDDEFDQRDFQIPPVNLIREFTTIKDLNYERYIEEDIERRRRIHQKWGSKGNDNSISEPIVAGSVKTEPVDPDCSEEDGFLIGDDESLEPVPGSSHKMMT